jgi:RimJ/RimL family protein N-acetyltransferase
VTADLLFAAPAFPEELPADGLLLRLPRHEDVATIAPAFTDPAVGGEAGLPPFGEAELHEVLDEILPEWRADGRLAPYLVLDADDGRILGGLQLHHFDPMRGTIEVGYWLFVDARGRGVATRAVAAAAAWAFANGIYRLEAVVRTGNAASERVLERAGFLREGVMRGYLRYREGRADATRFARLADDA